MLPYITKMFEILPTDYFWCGQQKKTGHLLNHIEAHS